MAAEYVSSTEDTYNSATPATSRTVAFSLSANTKRLICVFVHVRLNENACSGVTFDGDAMTAGPIAVQEIGAADNHIFSYYLPVSDAKSSGSYNVVVSYAGSGINQTYITVAEIQGVDPTSPLDNSTNQDTGASSPATMNLTPTVDNCCVLGSFISEANSLDTPSNGTAYQDWDIGSAVTASMYQDQTTKTASNMQYSYSPTGDDYCSVTLAFAPYAAAAGIEGTLTVTLGDITVDSDSALPVSGSLDKTLEDLSISSAAALAATGSLAVSLGDLNITAQAEILLNGALAETLEDITLAAEGSGSVEITGSLDISLDGYVISSAADLHIQGETAVTLGDLTAVITGNLPVTGSLDQILDGYVISSAGELPITAESANTLEDFTVEAAGAAAVIISGSLIKTLEDITAAAVGELPVTGSLAETLDELNITVQAEILLNGALDQSLSDLGISAAGQLNITAQTAETLSDLEFLGRGYHGISGETDLSLDAWVLSAAGSLITPASGPGNRGYFKVDKRTVRNTDNRSDYNVNSRGELDVHERKSLSGD